MFSVQSIDAALRNCEQLGIVRRVFSVGIGKVAEQSEVKVRVVVGEAMDFESLNKFLNLCLAQKNRRYDNECSRIFRDAAGRIHARQQTRWEEMREVPVEHRH